MDQSQNEIPISIPEWDSYINPKMGFLYQSQNEIPNPKLRFPYKGILMDYKKIGGLNANSCDKRNNTYLYTLLIDN